MNFAHHLLAAVSRTPDATALSCGDTRLTYQELADQSARFGGGLVTSGIGPGDRIALACANGPEFVVALVGGLRAGAVVVPLNPLGTGEEVAAELSGTGTGLVVADRTGMPAVDAARQLDGVEVTVVEAGGPGWDALVAAEPSEVVERDGDDVAVLVHTSGTSGPPRAAMLTHANLAANVEQMQRHPGMRLDADDVVLAVLPFFHVFGLNAVLGLGLATGAELVVVDRFDPASTLELAAQRGVNVVAGVPTMFAAWLDLPEPPNDAFRDVRLAVSGAAPLPAGVQARFAERFGVALHQGYGLTEASPVVSAEAGDETPRPGCIGVPLPGVEVRLVDTSGDDALVGDPGEIWVRGPNVFAGYWDDAEATRRVLTADGWLRTGDVGVVDDAGRLTIVDRSKDLIIVSGFNVYPAEVEDVLSRHPGVADAAVLGVPHAQTGEAVKAFVVAAPGAAPTPEELAEFCGRSLARYKCPVEVEVVEALPRGLAGKLRRRELGTLDGSAGTSDGVASRNPA